MPVLPKYCGFNDSLIKIAFSCEDLSTYRSGLIYDTIWSFMVEFQVLASKDHIDWDWDALQYLFLSPQCSTFLKSVGVEDMVRRFYRRLIFFYQPSSQLFSAIEQAKDGNPDKNR